MKKMVQVVSVADDGDGDGGEPLATHMEPTCDRGHPPRARSRDKLLQADL